MNKLLDDETVTASSWSSSLLGNGGRATRQEHQAAEALTQPRICFARQAVLLLRRDLLAVSYLPAWRRRRRW